MNKDASIGNRALNPTWITTSPYMIPEDVYCRFLHYANWTDVFIVLPLPTARQWLHNLSRALTANLANCRVRITGSQIISTRSVLRNFLRESRGTRKVLLFGPSALV